MARIKEAGTIVVTETLTGSDARFGGLYHRDTRYLSRFDWELPPSEALSSETRKNQLIEHYAVVDDKRRQHFSVRRVLTVDETALEDRWTIRNTDSMARHWSQTLIAEAAMEDLFARYAPVPDDNDRPIVRNLDGSELTFRRTSMDGRELGVLITLPPGTQSTTVAFDFEPGEERTFVTTVTVDPDDGQAKLPDLPTYEAWRKRFDLSICPEWQPAFDRAVDDLRGLLLPTRFGPYPAAGMPWFGNKFGRDGLITAMMILPWAPDVMQAVLMLLAEHRGKVDDPFREEEPGKILHEIREGELSRTDKIPFGRYYGSVDATALFVMAIDRYVEHSGDIAFLKRLEPALRDALRWLTDHLDGPTGLLRFNASGSGLVIQSWKDSHDSMNHADGTPAEQPLAVAEVQGYAFAAFEGATRLLSHFDDPEAAQNYRLRADALKRSFHERFWLKQLGTYAMALDKDLAPLCVLSSDPGHLLWCGIVPVDTAPQLVATLMSPDLWSGWGLRTLGSNETRYAPSSYHNGSVWPHDTALFGAGLARYGFREELDTVRRGLFELAMNMPEHRIPELISGHPREPGLGPVHYGNASSPQAWAAAALPMLAQIDMGMEVGK
ncbi:MAG: amylo-alpha-1,6-glucosidase [Parerythrobacter sp.]